MRRLTEAMSKGASPLELEGIPQVLEELAEALPVVTARLEPKVAAAACSKATAILSQAIAKNTDSSASAALARGLSALATGLAPEAAVKALTEAIGKTSSPDGLVALAKGLFAVADRLDARAAAAACSKAATLLNQALSKAPFALEAVADDLKAVGIERGPLSQSQRTVAVVGAAANGNRPFSTLTLLYSALGPPRCRLTTPELVELLKGPLCVDEARRIVLDALGARYQRHFADQWEFVHFAEQQNLGLDFSTPPQRPASSARP
jgi:hypothetical protein